jgi:hypothetical protein
MSRGLGRWYAPDPRSQRFLVGGQVKRTSVLHTADGPILDQDGLGACGGFTNADILNTAKFRPSRMRVLRDDFYLDGDYGLGFYSFATKLDEWPNEQWPPDDVGTSMVACAKAMQRWKYIDRYEWAPDFASFLHALEQQPVMLGTLWTDGMSDPDSKGIVRPTGELAGGHAYMAFGVNYPRELIRCRNHWTEEWGYGGDFFVRFSDMEWLIAEQGEVVVPRPVSVPPR